MRSPARQSRFNGQKDEGLFVGIWVPSILSFGAYLKCAGRAR